jgi:hypothetical protein
MDDKQKALLARQLNIIGEIAECVRGGEAIATVEMCSGGSRKASKPGLIPAIFLDADDAIISWRIHLSAYLRSTRVAQFKFLESPRLERLQITEADRGMQQRIVADRFGMVSVVGVVAYKVEEPAPVVKSVHGEAIPDAGVNPNNMGETGSGVAHPSGVATEKAG